MFELSSGATVISHW